MLRELGKWIACVLIAYAVVMFAVSSTHEASIPIVGTFSLLSAAPWPLLLGVLVLVFLFRGKKGGDPVAESTSSSATSGVSNATVEAAVAAKPPEAPEPTVMTAGAPQDAAAPVASPAPSLAEKVDALERRLSALFQCTSSLAKHVIDSETRSVTKPAKPRRKPAAKRKPKAEAVVGPAQSPEPKKAIP